MPIIFGVWLAQSTANARAFSATSYDHVVLSATTVKESNGKFDVTLGYTEHKTELHIMPLYLTNKKVVRKWLRLYKQIQQINRTKIIKFKGINVSNIIKKIDIDSLQKI